MYNIKAVQNLYDVSYLGSKTTITTGEWSYLISFARAPPSCKEQEGSEKFKMKMYGSNGNRTSDPWLSNRKPRLHGQTKSAFLSQK